MNLGKSQKILTGSEGLQHGKYGDQWGGVIGGLGVLLVFMKHHLLMESSGGIPRESQSVCASRAPGGSWAHALPGSQSVTNIHRGSSWIGSPSMDTVVENRITALKQLKAASFTAPNPLGRQDQYTRM